MLWTFWHITDRAYSIFFVCLVAYFTLLKIDYFLIQYIMIIIFPPSIPPYSPQIIPFLSLIRNKQTEPKGCQEIVTKHKIKHKMKEKQSNQSSHSNSTGEEESQE